MKQKRKLEERRFVARLIFCILTDKMCVREALLKFPKNSRDKTLKASYHALVHREADEDLRIKDSLYKEEQDGFLELVAQTLEKGEDLPDNIIRSYGKYYKDTNEPRSRGMKGLIDVLCRFLNV